MNWICISCLLSFCIIILVRMYICWNPQIPSACCLVANYSFTCSVLLAELDPFCSGLERRRLQRGGENSRSISILRELERTKVSGKSQITSMDKAANVVLDIDGLPQQPDKCCTGSPKMTRALSRKGSNRMERRGGEEQEQEDCAKKFIIKVVPSQLEQLKLPLVQNKTLVAPQCAVCTPVLTDTGEGRNKRFNRLTSVHPRKILLLFATLSSVGTMILIYFTLAINSKTEI